MREYWLRPCPFCGVEKVRLAIMDAPYSAECTACGARGPRCDNAEIAAKAWNNWTEVAESLRSLSTREEDSPRHDPNSSLLRWHRHDGAAETLPDPGEYVVLVKEDALPVVATLTRDPDCQVWELEPDDTREVEKGDVWAVLPDIPDGVFQIFPRSF